MVFIDWIWVYFVDDYLIFLWVVVSAIRECVDMEFVGMVGNGMDAVVEICELEFDVVLFDVRLRGFNGL